MLLIIEIGSDQSAGRSHRQFCGLLAQLCLGSLTGLGDLFQSQLFPAANGLLEFMLRRDPQCLRLRPGGLDDGFRILQRIALTLLVFRQQLLRLFTQSLSFLQLLSNAFAAGIEPREKWAQAHARRDGKEDDEGDGNPEILASEHQRRASIASSTAERVAVASGVTSMSFCVTACATSEAMSTSCPLALRMASSIAASSWRVRSACSRAKASRRRVCSALIWSLLSLRIPPASERALAKALS